MIGVVNFPDFAQLYKYYFSLFFIYVLLFLVLLLHCTVLPRYVSLISIFLPFTLITLKLEYSNCIEFVFFTLSFKPNFTFRFVNQITWLLFYYDYIIEAINSEIKIFQSICQPQPIPHFLQSLTFLKTSSITIKNASGKIHISV